MVTMLRTAAVAAILVLVAACGGSSGTSGTKSYKVTLIAGTTADNFYVTMNCGAQAEAKKLGVTYNFTGPNHFDAPTQIPVVNTVTAIAKDIKIDFDVTTQTWDHRVQAQIESKGDYERIVKMDDAVYTMLDEGTKAHTIRPRKSRVLRFMTPFRAKTVPNQIRSNAGSTGGNAVFVRVVHHPGTKARNWTKTIAEKWRRQAPTVLQRAIDAEYR